MHKISINPNDFKKSNFSRLLKKSLILHVDGKRMPKKIKILPSLTSFFHKDKNKIQAQNPIFH